ncbi:methylosome subunit pICln-like [Trichoplusia ni]|uniref:Methylosome subunit pICln-like n=1 Tax=Trichoplusia ni TaxID=7111 RepID=A0A7E5WTS1_TRINI|nr:methylosome subunit pICln-like [Trichoplusia ni]
MVVVSPTFSVPVEGILMQLPSVQLIVNNDVDLGTATLYITENNVVWGGGTGKHGGPSSTVTLLYPAISLHAIQRDPGPGLILVINHELSLPELTQQGGGDAGQDIDDDYDADEEPMTKLRFVPANENDLEAMFLAMNQGQALHPDPADEVDEDDYLDGEEFDDGDDAFEDAEEVHTSPEEAAARLRQLHLQQENGERNNADERPDERQPADENDDMAEIQ